MPKIYIEGPAGKLEGVFHQAEESKAPTAIVLHPHPLYGGTMNNKVVYHLYKAFVNNGFSVLRFNFRGVGNSQGTFDNGAGELSDVNAALDWLHMQNKNSSHYWVSGFSFGAYVGMQTIMRRPEIEGFIMAAPPVSRYNFGFFSPCPISGLIVQGEEDEIANPVATRKFADTCRDQKGVFVEYEEIESADHFFKDHLEEFDEVVDDYIKMRLTNRIVKPIVKQRKRSKNKKKLADKINNVPKPTRITRQVTK